MVQWVVRLGVVVNGEGPSFFGRRQLSNQCMDVHTRSIVVALGFLENIRETMVLGKGFAKSFQRLRTSSELGHQHTL